MWPGYKSALVPAFWTENGFHIPSLKEQACVFNNLGSPTAFLWVQRPLWPLPKYEMRNWVFSSTPIHIEFNLFEMNKMVLNVRMIIGVIVMRPCEMHLIHVLCSLFILCQLCTFEYYLSLAYKLFCLPPFIYISNFSNYLCLPLHF